MALEKSSTALPRSPLMASALPRVTNASGKSGKRSTSVVAARTARSVCPEFTIWMVAASAVT